ncbi:MAG: DMT family transporter [Candidatus Acidiferrales bacterium]
MLYFLIILMVLAWSFNFIVAKRALEEVPPLTLLFLRVLFSNIILLALYLGKGMYKRRPLAEGDWKWFALLGLFGIAGNQTGFTVGLHYTTVAHSSLIISLTPILVLLMATRMKLEAFTKLKVLGMLLSFSGVAVLVSEHGFGSASGTFGGDLLTFAGSICFALYTVYGKKVAGRYDTLSLNTYMYLFGGAAVFVFTAREVQSQNWLAISWEGWLGALYMAAFASVLGYLIFYYALTKISASRVIAFSYLQPVLATLLSVLLLGDRVTTHLLVGGALVLVGVALAERGRS